MNSYQYTNTVQGATSIAADNAVAANIYTIDRNGIGYIRVDFENQNITANVFSFEWYGENPGPVALPNWYNMVISDSIVGSDRIGIMEIGSVVVVGCVYAFGIFPNTVTYIAQPGNTTEDVRDGLVAAINAESWPDTVAVIPVSTNRYQVTVDDNTAVFLTRISLTLYKSGYYCQFSINGGPVKDYLIVSNSDVNSYPALPTLESSYLYSTLTEAYYSIEVLLEEPPYGTNSFSDTSLGTTDITGSPQVGTVPTGKVVYYNSRIYFAEPMNTGEVIKMIVL